MRPLHLTMAASITVSMTMLAGVVVADDGLGVCAAGIGVAAENLGAGTFVGVNVGTTSTTGVYESQAQFEAECCAETGSPPDCFEQVG